MPLINGDSGPNNLFDTAGDDVINGLEGNDTITVTNGNDSANGGDDFDTLEVNYGGATADISGGINNAGYGDLSTQNVGFSAFERFVVITGSGNDTIGTAVFGNGNDIVNVGAGNDQAETGVGDDAVTGGSGNDLIDVGTGDDTADGGADNDRISANMSAATGAILWNLQINTYSGAIGSFTNFEYFGIVSTGDGNDHIYTGTGNFDDTVNLGGGDDVIHVVLGGDSVNGQGGEDILYVDYGGSTAAVTTGLTSFGNGVDRNVVFAAFEIFNITTGSGDDVISTADYSGDDAVTLGNGNDLAATGAGADTLNGGGGADALDGGSGADVMFGGDGNDLMFVDNAGDQAFETNALPSGGIDTVQSSVNYTLAANIERLTLVGAAISGTGNGINNVITGNANANVLNGGGGSDSLVGGTGNDTYFVDSNGDTVSEAASAGTDLVRSTISFTLPSDVENLTLEGSANISGFGNGLANIITGNSGNNGLNGGAGVDSLRGGDGNDTYTVDDAGDVVIETSAAGGTDLVQSSINFILGGNVENLTLTGSGNINGTGNALANVITGNSGNNTLNGGAGVDSLRGGDGDDFYLVNDAGDLVIETSAAGGVDTVQSSVSFLLGGNVENLTLIGTATNGTGNALNNIITGNNQANVLNGGFGADTMIGGLGNDTYQVDNTGDLAFESTAGGGVDLVQSSVNFTLAQHVDNLTLTGAGAINGTGNSTANTINGNGANNVLDGAGGNDIINAGNGADLLLGGAGNDTLDGSTGNDEIYGGLGNDTMTGGSGSDEFFFDSVLNGTTNVDALIDFSVAADTIFLDDSSFAGLPGAGTLAAGAFRAGTVAVDADDRLLYDSATGQIRWDSDGVGGAAAILFATVAPGTALTNADFVGY